MYSTPITPHTLQTAVHAAKSGHASLVLKNAHVVDVFTEEILLLDVAIEGSLIVGLGSYTGDREIDLEGAYVCPGFIDSHVHIESSMSHPAGYARAVLPHGTTTIIADPHEIANVLGSAGIRYLLQETENLPLNVLVMMPSCVPCTGFETSGAVLKAEDLQQFLSHPRVLGLGEVMDYVAAANAEQTMLEKLLLFYDRPIDGHAPLVSGNDLNAYCVAGPSSDHECSQYEEMLEKLRRGLTIQLRMGSAAHGIEAMFRRIAYEELPTDNMLFCTDDKHLENIRQEGHINHIIQRAVSAGIGTIKAIRMATINAARAYGLKRIGAVAPGYRADLVILDNLRTFTPKMVFVNGHIYEDDVLPEPKTDASVCGSVRLAARQPDMLDLPVKGDMPVIELIPGQLVTKCTVREVPTENGLFQPGLGLNKLAVIERHHATGEYALGILSGLGIQNGAIASTVAHDSHNLIVAGDNDRDMLLAIDTLEACGGGYVVISGGEVKAVLPLPIAGIMTDIPMEELLEKQQALLAEAAALGAVSRSDPFITLSFLALPVIPAVRLTDQGLFDVTAMRFM
ncbi:MAG: adenine deaminase [Eubacteriales bacterium]|nr:adenine deaminase [Eubacteriales bacterium]